MLSDAFPLLSYTIETYYHHFLLCRFSSTVSTVEFATNVLTTLITIAG